jgi:pimeloyl-ACP methyl ester carboxylesterase
VLLAVLAAACSTGTTATTAPSPTTTSAPPPASPSPSLTPLEPLEQRCGSPNVPSRVLWFPARDGAPLDGAVVGSGRVGVVLGHQYPAELCGWWPFAVYLARHGVRVLLFDFRCMGQSPCPSGNGSDVDDMVGAAAELRRLGATKVFVGGASLGGTVAMMAGPQIKPQPAGVLSFSGEPDLGYLTGGFTKLDAISVIPKLRAPFLEIMARGDPAVSVADARELLARAGSRDKRLIVLSTSFGHGWDIVTQGVDNSPSPVAPVVLRWIQTHMRG